MQEIILLGNPITKKNSQNIIFNRKTKRRMIIPGEAYKQYAKDCLAQLQGYRGIRFEDVPLHVRCLYWMRDRRSKPDLINLLQATSDILEDCGVIDNDRNIVSYDGSRIVGLDKDNPRVEIIIEEAESKEGVI